VTDESYSFATARTRLEEIVAQVRKKDTSLEKSLDLLEEGVRLANQCTELIDHADWEAGMEPGAQEAVATQSGLDQGPRDEGAGAVGGDVSDDQAPEVASTHD
jgi:exodeoxyribonuclease VII small subunit